MQPKPTSAHRKPVVYIPPALADATHVFVRRGGVQPSFATPFEGPYRIVERTDAGYRVSLPGGRQEIVALARLKPAHLDMDDAVGDPVQDLDDARPPSPRPPGRPPGPRTRRPEPTDRTTRSGRPLPDWSLPPTRVPRAPQDPPSGGRALQSSARLARGRPAAARSPEQPRQPAARRRRPNRVPHIAEYNKSSADASSPNMGSIPSASQEVTAGPDTARLTSPAAELSSPHTTEPANESEHLVTDPTFGVDDEDDMSAQPSLFELGEIIHPAAGDSTTSGGPQSTLGPARASRRDDVPGDLQPSTSSGPAHYFSARRTDQGNRKYFSDVRPPTTTRPTPDVSVIFQHLGMTPSGRDSGPPR